MLEPVVEESCFLCLALCPGDRLLEQELENLLSPSMHQLGPMLRRDFGL